MSKKMIFLLIIIFLIVLGLFIFSEIEYRKNLLPEKAQLDIVQEPESKKTELDQAEKEEEKVEPSGEKPKTIKTLGQIPLEELKQKGAKKEKEEFDLTPSIDDLIRMKKEKIKAY